MNLFAPFQQNEPEEAFGTDKSDDIAEVPIVDWYTPKSIHQPTIVGFVDHYLPTYRDNALVIHPPHTTKGSGGVGGVWWGGVGWLRMLIATYKWFASELQNACHSRFYYPVNPNRTNRQPDKLAA